MTLALVTALCAPSPAAPPHTPPPAPVERGAHLFDGTEPLAGTLSGHAAALPTAATRCIQCHSGPGKPIANGAGQTMPLGGPQLQEHRARRGGPPTAYDAASFCRTLRTGIDPAHVVLPRAMPRFDASDAQCAALWDYLTRGAGE